MFEHVNKSSEGYIEPFKIVELNKQKTKIHSEIERNKQNTGNPVESTRILKIINYLFKS